MPYASHRIVGVMELEPICSLDKSNQIQPTHSLAALTTAAIRRIKYELAESKSTAKIVFEPTVEVDSATLQRELEADLASYLAGRDLVALN